MYAHAPGSRRLRPRLILLGLALLVGCPELEGCPIPPAELASPPWPRWAHEHWVWENSGDEVSARALVDGYLARDIPVGAVIIDRPWQTEPMTFEPDPALYPNLGRLVDDFHRRDVRVMMWAVSVINDTASTFEHAKQQGYFLSDGKTVPWWAGDGAHIDYTNPRAVDWWHERMDAILDLGIDGWKCDATDPTVLLLLPPIGEAGQLTWAQYRDLYYRDYFEYTRSRLGPDRIITARPSDSWFGPPLPIPFAPRDVNFAGWVGDQDGTFDGLRAALNNMTASSWLGYVSFGSDIGGFRGSGLRDTELMVRWAQLGALSPVMENGGGGEHRPWMYGDDVTDIYRRFTVLHHELIPYLYSQGARSWERGESLMQLGLANDYQYRLGEALLVAPMVRPGTQRIVELPAGRFIDWLDESVVHEGPGTVVLDVPLDRYPVFVQEGAIVPLDVTDDSTGHGGAFSSGHVTVAMYPTPGATHSFDLYEEHTKSGGITLGYRYVQDALVLEASPTDTPLLFRVRGAPSAAGLREIFGDDPVAVGDPRDLGSATRTVAEDGVVTWIRIADPGDGVRLVFEPAA